MKKTKIKGFTLVECIVAMTIFAIASLTIAQVYVTVTAIQKENEYMQYSLANQMKYVENESTGEAVDIELSDVVASPPTAGNAKTTLGAIGGNVVKMYKINPGSNGFDGLDGIISGTGDDAVDSDYVYYVGVDMFVYKSRTGSSASTTEDVTYDDSTRVNTDETNSNLRYKFMKPS